MVSIIHIFADGDMARQLCYSMAPSIDHRDCHVVALGTGSVHLYVQQPSTAHECANVLASQLARRPVYGDVICVYYDEHMRIGDLSFDLFNKLHASMPADQVCNVCGVPGCTSSH